MSEKMIPPRRPAGPLRNAGRWIKRAGLRLGRCATARKIHFNTRLNQKEIWHGRARLASYPRQIQLGTNWTCNLQCPFCRRQLTDKERLRNLKPAQRELAPGVLQKILDVAPYLESLSLTPLGEPLMYSGLETILNWYERHPARNLHMTTNATLLNERWAHRLVEAGTRRIYVSVDSPEPETYAAMRVGGDLNKVTHALRALARAKRQHDTPWPEVVLAATFLRRNIEHLPELVRYARGAEVDIVSVQLMEAYRPDMESETLAHYVPLLAGRIRKAEEEAERLGIQLWLSVAVRNLVDAWSSDRGIPKLVGDGPINPNAPSRLMSRCVYPWISLMVDTDGEARPCCWASVRYGNLNDQSFDAVWNGQTARGIRRAFLVDQLPAGCRNRHCRVDLPDETGWDPRK